MKRQIRSTIDIDLLRKMVSYNQRTGEFHWKISTRGHVVRGSIAGSIRNDGYVMLRINKTSILAHRAAWMIVTGAEPPMEIDHINGNPCDNRWSNLREATRHENTRNAKLRKNKSVPFKGVAREGNRYRAIIRYNGKQHRIGVFATPEEAHAAYVAKAIEVHGEFARFS